MKTDSFEDRLTVARADLLDRLCDLTYETGGEGRLIAVVGEPGAGKTHLLAALVQERQWTALPASVHRCSREDGGGTAIDAARTLLRRARRGRARAEGASVTALPRRRRPARELLVLEDAHLADEQTVRELVALAHGDPAPLVDVVVSLRPGQAPPELIEAITLTAAFGGTERLDLEPLTDEQMTAMSPVRPSYELRRRSGGNPFRLRALQALEHAARTRDGGAVAPFEFAVLHETRDLGMNERYVLHAAAILRARFDVELLTDVAGVDAVVASAVVRSLVRRDLVRVEQPIETLFSIRDEVFGTLLRRTIDPCWAASAHQRAVQRLSARGQAGAQLGFHLASSSARVRGGELDQIVAASEEMLDSDVTEAVFCLTPVLAETAPSSPLGMRARLALSTAFGRLGRLDESRELLFVVHEASLDHPGPDEAALASATAFVSGVEAVLSQDVQTLDLLQEYARRPSLTGPARALLVFARGFREAMFGLPADADEVAAALAAHAAADPVRAGLLSLTALTAVDDGDVAEGAAAVEEAGRLLDRLPEHQMARHLEAVCAFALACLYLGRYNDGQRQLRRAVGIARRRQGTYLLPTLLVLLSESERHLGLLRQARDSADAAIIESAVGNALRHCQAVALKSAAEVWMQPPGSGLARSLAQQALGRQTPLRVNVNGSASLAAITLAQCSWLEGDPVHCVALLLNEGRGPDLPGVPTGQRTMMWELLCAAGMDAGMPLDAWVEASRAHTADAPMPHNLAYTDLARGHLCRVQGSLAEAARLYQRAAERFASVGMAIAQCYTLGHAARVHTELGAAGRASQCADLALEIARRAGAETLTAWLRDRTSGPEDGPCEPIAALEAFGRLTGREREIALLICTGLSRREIAERLTISPRTVDVHLTRVYRKTGVTSRMQLALAFQQAEAARG
ncbi:LuxR C-terminal-related transcriptional regulator [Actinocorallia sp. API 0066]|uniref:LuxR family transcriptional regulator n=1 Tax=Actinocorallia sp. API 0066 TaxID=2896846 RepID=UPI001E2A2ED0|nr:LuxR family transcriptional regulator [Actinocorallia sp. API 0066]MCD0451639.1 LuxR C-terminal-related transcriptional regulator [Actinocorallia sp. API 0066]